MLVGELGRLARAEGEVDDEPTLNRAVPTEFNRRRDSPGRRTFGAAYALGGTD